MKAFFKYFGAALLAFVIGGFIVSLIMATMVGGAIGNSFGEMGKVKPLKYEKSSILHLKFDSPIGERGFSQPNFGAGGLEMNTTMGISNIKVALTAAKTDEKIKGIYMDVTGLMSGMASLEEVRSIIEDFKTSGKFVIAYSEAYSQASYYLATTANEIHLYPEGMIDFKGLGVELMFFKNMLDKWDVDLQVIRGSNNKFKSAVEPFLYDHMSDANRAQMETLLGAMWNRYKAEVSAARGISVEKLDQIADSTALRTANDALDYKFVDALTYKDELISKIKEKVGLTATDDLEVVEFGKYSRYWNKKMAKKNKNKSNIAIVYAQGSIVSGDGDMTTIGSEGTSKALRKARLNPDIKAVVLRVNSGGGSALASDVIWREVDLIKQSGKPMIVSMGDYAASGGYYISCAAHKIYAQPNTLTGSIGVFGVIPNLQNMLKNHVGITTERVETNDHAVLSMTQPLTEKEKRLIQIGVDDIYGLFKQRVADGRPTLNVAQVDSIGQGRVWSGTDALRIGLVDELGGIDDAVAFAASQAGIADSAVVTIGYPEMPQDDLADQIEMITEMLGGKDKKDKPTISGQLLKQVEMIDEISQMKGIQARMPYEIVIK